MQAISGPISAAFVIAFFTPEDQGLYYTFVSLISFQILVELGLSTVITTVAAHEWVKLRKDTGGCVVGNLLALSRLGALLKYSVRWYALGALVLFGGLHAAGQIVLVPQQAVGEGAEWLAPWISLSAVASLALIFQPLWAVLAGTGELAWVARFRMVETLVRSVVLWLGIWWGAHLWAVPLASAAALLLELVALTHRHRVFFSQIWRAASPGVLRWSVEVVPMQSRIAVSWASGMFIFSLFTPVTFATLGAEAAGRVGLTWALASAVSGIAGTWTQVRAPMFAGLVATRSFKALDQVARRTAVLAVALSGVMGCIALFALLIAESRFPSIAQRFLPAAVASLFLVADLPHQISMVQSTYLRAFKREPFVGVSIAGAVVVGVVIFLATPRVGLVGPALSYFLGMLVILVYGSIIFSQRRREWTEG